MTQVQAAVCQACGSAFSPVAENDTVCPDCRRARQIMVRRRLTWAELAARLAVRTGDRVLLATLDAEAATRLRESWEQMFAGPRNAGRTAVLEEGMSIEKIQMSSEDLQFIDTRKLQRQEIAAIFRVSWTISKRC